MLDPDFRKMAEAHGWQFIEKQENISMVSYQKIFNGYPARINIYLTKMTVATAITHPKQGKTQLFRRNVSPKLLEKIFQNPRHHSGVGYKQRRERLW